TVVGTCQDCIVSVPPAPPASLRFRLNVVEGQNLVLKQVGTLSSIYPASGVGAIGQRLTPTTSMTLGPVQGLAIATTAPLTVEVTTPTAVNITFNVNTMLVLDDKYTAVVITNSAPVAANSPNADVSVYYAQPQS
ncbi:hypothetical protein, partial [Vibrio cidicii]